jgi:hypothetical protein
MERKRVVSVNRGTPLLTDSEVFDPKKMESVNGGDTPDA